MAMPLTRALYRNSPLFFLSFFVLVLWGFWNSYYSNPLQFSDALVHAHGFVMTLWCLMLVTQSYLVRTNRKTLHQRLGRLSYVLAPLNVILMVTVVRQNVLNRPVFEGELTPLLSVFLSLTLVGAAVFSLLYGLAIAFRRNPALHGRFMLCTPFPILAAAIDRILTSYFPGIAALLPEVAGVPYRPFVTWALVDGLLVGLSIWDWQSNRRLGVFPIVLLILLAYHSFTANAYRAPLWNTFGEWFLGL
jgi:hypothetical protein